MNINKYTALIKVAELGSFTKAAECLNYTQSGISHIISSLEDEVGFPLLHRYRNGVRLTADGAMLLQPMYEIVYWHMQIQQMAEDLSLTKLR